MRKNFLQRQYYLSQWYYSKRLTGVLLVSFLNMQLNFIIRDFVLQLPIFFSAQFFTALVSFKFARMDFSGLDFFFFFLCFPRSHINQVRAEDFVKGGS